MTEAEFLAMLPAIKRKARRFKAVFANASMQIDDIFQAGAVAAWEAACKADDRPSSPLPVFCRKKAGWAMVDAFRRELVHVDSQRRAPAPAYDTADQRQDTERRVDLISVCRVIDQLPPDQREVLRRLYADGQEQAEAGAALGITQSRVSQIKSKAVTAVRRGLNL